MCAKESSIDQSVASVSLVTLHCHTPAATVTVTAVDARRERKSEPFGGGNKIVNQRKTRQA